MYPIRSFTSGYHYSPPSPTPAPYNNYHHHHPQQQQNNRTSHAQYYQPTSPTRSNLPPTPTRRVNPALSANTNHPRPFYSTHGKQQAQHFNFSQRNNRAEIDDSPIIDPRAFQYLNSNERKGKKKPISDNMESGIDSRPIINLDAVAQLERRRQQQLEKNNRLRGDDGSKGGIDDRSIVDVNAFRYIEGRTNKVNKQGQNMTSGIDDRPITNPDAFK